MNIPNLCTNIFQKLKMSKNQFQTATVNFNFQELKERAAAAGLSLWAIARGAKISRVTLQRWRKENRATAKTFQKVITVIEASENAKT